MKAGHILVTLFALVPVLAFAHAGTPRVDQRQINQERRIDQGIDSGSLTQREARRLDRGQQHVNNIEDRARSDGVVSRHERAHLHRAQERQSYRIYAQKHDRQHDYNHNGRTDRRLAYR